VDGNKIVDVHGEPVQFRGMSFFWSQWESEWWNADVVNFLVDDWKCTLVRAAMGVESGGYLDNPNAEKNRVIAVTDAAIAKGIYVIIDWHDHAAQNHVGQATTFFTEMAQKYGQYANVIFETFNEPLQDSWADVIKPYHEKLVPVIRNYAPDSIIVLGTKTWSQDVDEAADNRVQGTNLAYTLHFYAATHKGSLRDKARAALNKGIALMVTEWGTCDASGNGALDLDSSWDWINFLNEYKISHANWAVSDKEEAASALRPGASGSGGWSAQDYTPSGNWVRNMFLENASPPGPSPPGSGGCCRFGADCGDCGEDGTGWCHGSAGNCATCTGSFDSSGPSPSCGGDGTPSPSPNPSPNPSPSPTPPTPQAPAGSPVALHGKLSVDGNKIVDVHGEPVQFRGMSFFWSQWESEWWNADVVNFLVDDWKCTLVRAAMGVESGGYLDNPNAEKNRVIAVTDAAIAKGIYVIIDWHDHAAQNHVGQATTFFTEMAQKYGQYANVIFETFNEPLQDSWADVIKPYHEKLVPVIRNYAPDSIIVLGTKTWSQDVDEAADNRVQGTNLAYTLHFYAATHKGSLRDKARAALNKGIALMVTEWGTCDASGNGALDLDSSWDWINFLNEYKISHANWAVSDKEEAASALRPGASGSGGWSAQDYTPSGNWVRNMFLENASPPGPSPPGSGGCCRFGADCGDCGEDGTGWCHGSASNCAECTGTFDSSGPDPSCGGVPTPSPSPNPSPPPTPPTTPPSPPGCSDANQYCEDWAANGECESNSGWMQDNCPASCGTCPTPVPCSDENEYCGDWAASGECQTNPNFMLENCRQSCGVCGLSAVEVVQVRVSYKKVKKVV